MKAPLTDEAFGALKKQSNKTVIQLFSGGVHIDNREINGSFNNSNLDNVNIQSDILQEYNLSKEDLETLEKDIELHSIDEVAKEQNLEFLKQFQLALKAHDKEQAKKYLTWIKKGVTNVASVMTIGTTLGFF
ncbi:hypothetical protein [Virgibacillus halodenitrificans]|uniref:hypothetical protein n=1 Tax=Virgibacillus halodenitrificans TaxID=1482 RepID=UPI000EF4AE69|nr:hypothetical protein [Virgibacillus halodenitrificans]